MKSLTYGEVTIEDIRHIIESRLQSTYYDSVEITVGTDSQSFSDHTKMVDVIAIRLGNNGGFFFYETECVNLIKNLHQKISWETSKSINLATTLFEELQKSNSEIIRNTPIKVHIDIGVNGPTNKLINEIVGWVSSAGFSYEIKPHSFAASTIANRISK